MGVLYDGWEEPRSFTLRRVARQLEIEREIELAKQVTPTNDNERTVEGIKITPVASLRNLPSRSYMFDADTDEEAVKIFKTLKPVPTQIFCLRKTYFSPVPDDDDTVPVFPEG